MPRQAGELGRSTFFIGRTPDDSLSELRDNWQAKAKEFGLNYDPIRAQPAFRYASNVVLSRFLGGVEPLDRAFCIAHGLNTPEDILAYAHQDDWFDSQKAAKPLTLSGIALAHHMRDLKPKRPQVLFLGVEFRGSRSGRTDADQTVHAERTYFETIFDPRKKARALAAEFPYVLLGSFATTEIAKPTFPDFVKYAETTLPITTTFSEVQVGGEARP